LHIGQNGLVEQAEIVQATNPGVGERLATSTRNWVFAPFVKDGVVHPAITNVKIPLKQSKVNKDYFREFHL
jgi:hypothetical protein